MRIVAVMQPYRERRDRMAVLSCPRGVSASFDRHDVVTVLRHVVGLDKVTTISQLEGNRWEVVLVDDNALKKFTDMVTIDIKGVAVDVSAFRIDCVSRVCLCAFQTKLSRMLFDVILLKH